MSRTMAGSILAVAALSLGAWGCSGSSSGGGGAGGAALAAASSASAGTSGGGTLQLLSSTPASGAQGVPLAQTLELEFDAPLDPATLGAVRLSDDLGPVSVDLRLRDPRTLEVDPQADLRPGRRHLLRVGTGLQSLQGARLSGERRIDFRSEEAHLRVGVAAVDVTPAMPNGMVLAGFGGVVTGGFIVSSAMRYATGVHDPIWARSVAVEDPRSGQTMILQSLDFVGMLQIDINPVKRRIARELGVPVENIVIACTHNHMAPDVYGIWAGGVDYVYNAWVRDRMFESAKAAFDGRRAARLRSATGEPPSGYDPQTLEIKRGAAVRLPQDFDSVRAVLPGYDVEMLQTDMRDPYQRNTKVVALQFSDAVTGDPIGTLVNWHDHPEALESDWLEISSDWPHYLRERMEARLGGTCVYFSGSVGIQIGALEDTLIPLRDVQGAPVYEPGVFDAQGNPFPQFASDPVDRIRSLGYVVADTAIDALAGASDTATPAFAIRTEPLDIDLTNPALRIIATLLMQRQDREPQEQLVTGAHISSPVGGVRTQVSVATLGDVQIVTAPGEIGPDHVVGRNSSSVDYGFFHGTWHFPAMPAVEAYMSGRDRMVFGLAHDYLGYCVPESDYIDLGRFFHPNFYEDAVSPGATFGDSVGNKLMEMLGAPVRFSSHPTFP